MSACYAAGMTDWLAKPLEPKRLYDALQKAVQARRVEVERAA